MTAHIRSITFDCADPYRLAHFWSQVTGYGEDPDNPNWTARRFPDCGICVSYAASCSLKYTVRASRGGRYPFAV